MMIAAKMVLSIILSNQIMSSLKAHRQANQRQLSKRSAGTYLAPTNHGLLRGFVHRQTQDLECYTESCHYLASLAAS
jgi:hypothetical protein